MRQSRKVLITLFSLALCLYVTPVFAYPVTTGQSIELRNGPGTTAGQHKVYEYQAGSGTGAYLFDTFCIEYNETLTYGGEFIVDDLSTEARLGGVGGREGTPGSTYDPLSDQTAWLYYSWVNDLNGLKDAFDADDMQYAIWSLEQELGPGGTDREGSLDLIELANDAVADGWFNDDLVAVMNLVYPGGKYAQDLLVANSVPEPATMLLLGAGLIGIAGLGRMKLK